MTRYIGVDEPTDRIAPYDAFDPNEPQGGVARREGRVTMPAAPRYHALDGLRAAMMFLGIYLHVVVAYATLGGWPYHQAELTSRLNFSILFIHIYRMPVFYVMAGFFAALLYERRGFRQAAANRALRILVPFVVGWAILFPLVVVLAKVGKGTFTLTPNAIVSSVIATPLHPLDLWFLEYLLVLYGLAIIAVGTMSITPVSLRSTLNRLFRVAVQFNWAPLLFATPSFAALLPMKWAGFEDPPSFIPAPRIVIAYAIPFAFGWLLYLNSDLLGVLRKHAWVNTVTGLVLSVPYYISVFGLADQGVAFFATRAVHSVALWCFIFGITGLFLRYLSAPNARVRYLSDSSYFLYLAHMPVVIVFQILLRTVGWPPLLKIPVVLAGTTLVLLTVYRYAVRPTFIGATLSGRRYPAGQLDFMFGRALRG